MTRTSIFLLAAALLLSANADAFARTSHAGGRGPAVPQRSCWSHIYNGAINRGHDAALARAEASLICG